MQAHGRLVVTSMGDSRHAMWLEPAELLAYANVHPDFDAELPYFRSRRSADMVRQQVDRHRSAGKPSGVEVRPEKSMVYQQANAPQNETEMWGGVHGSFRSPAGTAQRKPATTRVGAVDGQDYVAWLGSVSSEGSGDGVEIDGSKWR